MVKEGQELLNTKTLSIPGLYDAYAGMLLGYIFEVVKDRKLAEDYLVKTFCRVAENFNETDWAEANLWCLLQRFAKNELVAFYETAKSYAVPTGDASAEFSNAYLGHMTEQQKLVFCNIYYSKKTTTQLAGELNIKEAEVKHLLKEAFAIIRRSHGR